METLHKTLIKKVNLPHHECITWWKAGDKIEIHHEYMVDDGHEDVEWEFDIISVEVAKFLLSKYD